MKRFWLSISMILMPTLVTPCFAGGIFFKRNRPTEPSTRVPELIFALKNGQRASKRADAAEELRQFDASTHPEIVPALVQTLQSDGTWSVRREAAKSLGRIRPISSVAGRALQKTAKDDSNLLVRLQARSSLWGYYLGGFRSGEEDLAKKDPAKPKAPVVEPKTGEVVVQSPPAGPVLNPTQAPPVTQTPDVVIISPNANKPKAEVPRPLPKGRPWTTATPAQPLRQAKPPVILENGGPSLTPPPPPTPPKF